MTCGIDGDDDHTYSIYGLPQIPTTSLQIGEKLKGRDIQKLEASQNLSCIIKMILSRFAVRENRDIPQLISSSKKPPSLKGRHIQQLDSSHSLFHRDISIPIILKESSDSHFYKKDVIDLTFEVSQFEDEQHLESDWTFPQSQRFINSNINREDLTMEERLAHNGMTFDCQMGQWIECRSWLKKVGHSIEKNLRKGAKKTCKFVKEHKTEILIAAGVLIVGGCVSAGVYYLVGSELAKDAAGATIIATVAPFKDPPRRRREAHELSSSSKGPDPEIDLPTPSKQSSVFAPSLRIHENMTGKEIFDALSKPSPVLDPHLGIYKLPSSTSHLAKQPTPAVILPQANIEATAKQLFDKLFNPAPTPDPHLSIYTLDAINQRKIEKSMPAAPQSQLPQPATAPQSTPFQSEFRSYLHNLYSQSFDSTHMPSVNSIPDSNDLPPHEIENPISTSYPFKRIIDTLRQAITTIGEGINGPELLHSNTPLDPFNYTPSFSQNPILPSSISSSESSPGLLSINNHLFTSCPFTRILDEIREVIRRELCEEESLTNIPINLKHLPIQQADVEKSHVPILLFDAISLPRPPKAGMLPVLCPNGKLDWIVMTADWHQFNFSQEELDNGIVHLDEHFKEFMPKTGKDISLITSQNGINVSVDEFIANSTSDNLKIMASMSHKNSPSVPLSIGMYNPTHGLIKDVHRVSDEKKHIDTPIVKKTRHLMTTIANAAYHLNSDFLWLDLRHSEAGLIFCRAFEGMDENTQQKLHEHLLSVALGPAEPISNKMTKEAVNFYSKKDYITKRYAEPFMNHPDYDIRIIACISPRNEFSLYIADHARAGTTYDTALDKKIRGLNKEHGFYTGQQHE